MEVIQSTCEMIDLSGDSPLARTYRKLAFRLMANREDEAAANFTRMADRYAESVTGPPKWYLQQQAKPLPVDCIAADGSRTVYNVSMGRMMGVRGG